MPPRTTNPSCRSTVSTMPALDHAARRRTEAEMNRRQWLQSSVAAAAMPPSSAARGCARRDRNQNPAAQAAAHLDHHDVVERLPRQRCTCAYTRDGVTGTGEGAPIVRYQEDARSAQAAVDSVRDLLASADPWQFTKIMAQVFRRIEGQYAAKAAIDIALMDWVGQKLGVPLYRYFGLDPRDAPRHHVLHRHRHARDHAPEGARGRAVPGPQDQGRARHRRGRPSRPCAA